MLVPNFQGATNETGTSSSNHVNQQINTDPTQSYNLSLQDTASNNIPSDLYQLAHSSDVDNSFCALVAQRPEYQSLKDILVKLTQIAEGLISTDFSFEEELTRTKYFLNALHAPSASNLRKIWRESELARTKISFFRTLQNATPEPGPPILWLIDPATRTELVNNIANMKDGDERCKLMKLSAVSYLIRAEQCLKPAEREQLKNIWQALDLEKIIDKIIVRPTSPPSDILFCYWVKNLAPVFLAQSMPDQLKKLFTHVRGSDAGDYRICALARLAHAMPFFAERERNEFFYLIKEIGKTEIQKSPKMAESTIDLFKAMLGQTNCLDTEQLKTLIAFIMNYEDSVGRTELLCSLANAALNKDERLRGELTHALMAPLAKKQELDRMLVNDCMLRVLQIDWLPAQEHSQLVREILCINEPEERAHLLGLLASRMEYLTEAEHATVVDAILAISNEPVKSKALCAAAAGVVWLEKRECDRLLSAIQAIGMIVERAQTLSLLIAAVNKKLAGLSQPQEASLPRKSSFINTKRKLGTTTRPEPNALKVARQ